MKNKEENNSGWKDLAQTFLGSMLTRVGDNISTKIQEWISEVKRKALGAMLVAVGLVFMLVCLSLYINTFFSEGASWIGYGAVGIIILSIGCILSKK